MVYRNNFDRRYTRRALAKTGGAFAGLTLLGGSRVRNAFAQDPTSGTPGGTLNVAIIGEPPTLDVQTSTATIVGQVAWNMFEPLFTFDTDYNTIPMLAETHTVSDDKLVHTIALRQGVKFHNGETMTSADVIASFNKWSAASGIGGSIASVTEELVAVDNNTIEFRLSEPYGALVPGLSQNFQGMAVYPASVIEASPEGQLSEFIGTGPYKLVEHRPDQHILFERFADYVGRDEAPNGYGGGKMAYFDEIRFMPVPDEAARIAGLQAGDYHYLESISPDQSIQLEGFDSVTLIPDVAGGWETHVLNWKSPMMSNITLRKAYQAALDHNEILFGSQGEGFYRLDPGVMTLETSWHTTAGDEGYNVNNPDRAKELLEEAGYDGTPLRFLTTQEYNDHYNSAVIGAQQLENAGFTVELEIYDWATVNQRRTDPEVWDIFTTGISFKPDPTMLSMMQLATWPGWWDSEASLEAFKIVQTETEFEARYAGWEQTQAVFYEEVPMIKLGDSTNVMAFASGLQGLTTQVQLGVPYWNLWLEQ